MGANPPCQTYTVEQAAAVLGVSDDNLYARLKEGGSVAGVPGIKLGRSWRLPKDRIDALAVTGEAPPLPVLEAAS